MDLLTDQDMVTASAVPKVMPPFTYSPVFPEDAMISYPPFILCLKLVCEQVLRYLKLHDSFLPSIFVTIY